MYDVNDLPSLPVYEWDRAKKRAFLDAELSDLTDWHAARCPEYARMRDAWPARGLRGAALSAGAAVQGAHAQKRARRSPPPHHYLLRHHRAAGVQDFPGRGHLRLSAAGPLPDHVRLPGGAAAALPGAGQQAGSAQPRHVLRPGAGILGFSIFGTRPCYALDEHMELDLDGVRAFLEEHQGEAIFLFGFTFMIWKHVVRALEERGRGWTSPTASWFTAADGRSWPARRCPPGASRPGWRRPPAWSG